MTFIRSIAVSFAVPAALVFAQFGGPPSGGGGAPAPIQLPLSGRTGPAGSATAAQSSVAGTTASVNTLNSSVQVQGVYSGSAGTSAPLQGPLTLRDAVRRGLEHNLGAIGLAAALRQVEGQAIIARSAMMPNISGGYREDVQQTNLAAFGLRLPGIGPVVGPFGYFDARATATQSIVDLTVLNNVKAARELVSAAKLSAEDAKDVIVLAVGGAYLQTTTARARVASARVQLETTQAVYKQTLQSRQAGVTAQLEVNRAQVQEQIQRQRIATLENDYARQKINLARLVGLPPTDKYELAGDVGYSQAPALAVDAAVQQALETRADLKAAQAQIRAADRAIAAAKSERLPSLSAMADYGIIGPRFNEGKGTFTFVANLKIPIWAGGRATGDRMQAEAAMDQRRAEAEDLRSRIESDVRTAYLDLDAAASQIDLAKANQSLAREALRLAREKFDAGISTSVEVTQAQDVVASSDLDYLTSLFAHNVAKLSLARALGHTEEHLADYLEKVPQ